MPQYRVTIRKVVEADLVIEADSAAQARAMAKEQPADFFAVADSIDRDLFTVCKVTKAAD
ncbi:hypothetical protein [Herbaspirillum huttiense]|uniref:hypothetical protein n=1 Tax=Herbaspirillum huttiense TaxID=863372 RepID=UPI0039AF99E2